MARKLNEAIVYPDGFPERMDAKIEQDLTSGKHPLSKHPIFPQSDESLFEEQLAGYAFADVVRRYKRAFDVDTVNNGDAIKSISPLVYETMELERDHVKDLEKLAERIIREEYDMDGDVVDIKCEIVPEITLKNPDKEKNKKEFQFKNHDEMVSLRGEVEKRRWVNSMIEGSARKLNHLFNNYDQEIIELNPRLPNKYMMLMAAADYAYFIVPDMKNGINAGVVYVQFPNESNRKAVIHAQAMVFPALLHELVKGVMELIAAHGLPKNKRVGQYVVDKADNGETEPWDMRLGYAIWNRFVDLMEPDQRNLKHQIFCDLVSLPVNEFNRQMREIMAGTKEGKKIIDNMVTDITTELLHDETQPDTYGIDELIGGNGDVFTFDELLR